MIRVLRTPSFLLCSAFLALLLGIAQSASALPGDILFTDDFERASLAPNWTTSDATRSGIGTYTANTPTRSLYTRWSVVDVTSSVIDLSAVPAAELSMWIHVGDDTISEAPDTAGEDLIIQYLNDVATWVTLETFVGGTGGTEITGNIYNRSYTLPTNAMHAGFQIRISQGGGSGADWDYYHVDDVEVMEIAPPPPFSFGRCDDFENGLIYWTVNSLGGTAAVSAGTATVNSPSNSLYTAEGQVNVTSAALDTSSATTPTLSLWVRRGLDGLDGFSENPDAGEDLRIEYFSSTSTWITLDTLPGNGTAGEILNLSYALPANAIHANFAIRLTQTGGSGTNWDYWHIDDVCVTEPPTCDTYLDTFSAVSYVNNDGTLTWTGNWIETGDDGNPAGGSIQATGTALQLIGNGSGGTLGGPSIEREADLSTATSAILTFDYWETGNWEGNDDIDVYASNDGGTTWGLLNTFTNDQGATPQTMTIDITGYISSNTRIAFVERANSVNEVFYIDNVQIEACSLPIITGPDHYRIEHDGSGLTCSPDNIIVRACMDSTCASEYASPITATFAPDTWVGGVANQLTFNSGDTLQLQHTTAETATLEILATDASATNPTVCYIGGVAQANCDMVFYDSGFVFDVPNHTAATTQTVQISAVRANPASPDQCVPGFQNVTKSVGFWSNFSNPATGTLSVNINGTNIVTASPGTAFNLNFDANGQTTFDLVYPDVGLMQLNALHTGSATGPDSGLSMTGNDIFVSTPAAFNLSNVIRISDSSVNPAAADSSGAAFIPAGEPFSVTITAVNANGVATPNYGQETPAERVKLSNTANPDVTGLATLIAPGGGSNPPLATPVWEASTTYVVNQMVQYAGTVYQATSGGTSGATFGTGTVSWSNLGTPLNPAAFIFNASGAFTNGVALGTYAWPEVGIIDFTARVLDADYLGAGDVIGNSSGNVGRFYPADFDVIHNHNPACTAGTSPFTYAGFDDATPGPSANDRPGQTFSVDGSITARNTAGSTTINYAGGFAKLTAAGVDAVPMGGTGSIPTADWSVDPLSFTNGTTSLNATGAYAFANAAPFDPQSVYLSVTADDGEASGSETDNTKTVEYRFGQLLLINAFGPQTSDLSMQLEAQYHDGTDFVTNEDDSCTVLPALASVSLSGWTGNLSSGETTVTAIDATLFTGLGNLTLSAPGAGGDGNDGTVLVTIDATTIPWLRIDSSGDNIYMEDPSGTATFGLYRGDDRFLFWQE